MTAAGIPFELLIEQLQANVVAAQYDVPRLSLAPASATAAPPGLQTFSPGSSQDSTVTCSGHHQGSRRGPQVGHFATRGLAPIAAGDFNFPNPVAPGASAAATFRVTSGAAAFNGDLVSTASCGPDPAGAKHSETTAEKVRNAQPHQDRFRDSAGSPGNLTDSFIELYNAGAGSVDISNWTLTQHPAQLPVFSAVKIPSWDQARSSRLLPARPRQLGAGGRRAHGQIRPSTSGAPAACLAGGTISIDTGAGAETRKIVSVGTAAGNSTTVWQPLPEGPVIKSPAGSTSVPVTSIAGFAPGEKIAIGYGAACSPQ